MQNNAKHYESILGEKNTTYYQTRFEQFDKKGGGLIPDGNWAALLFTGVWALYRKMYSWFFLFWGIVAVSSIIEKAGAPRVSLAVLTISTILFAVFANSLYHRKLIKIIAEARSKIEDESKLLEYLKCKGGVNVWVIWVFVAMPVIGILLAIAIPILAGK